MPDEHLPLHSLVLHYSDGLLKEMCCTTEVKAQVVDNLPGGLQIQFCDGISSDFYHGIPVLDLEKLTLSLVGHMPNMNPFNGLNASQLHVIHLCDNGLEALLCALQPSLSHPLFASDLSEIVLKSIKFPSSCICLAC